MCKPKVYTTKTSTARSRTDYVKSDSLAFNAFRTPHRTAEYFKARYHEESQVV